MDDVRHVGGDGGQALVLLLAPTAVHGCGVRHVLVRVAQGLQGVVHLISLRRNVSLVLLFLI